MRRDVRAVAHFVVFDIDVAAPIGQDIHRRLWNLKW
jgi:hypothetical protein